MVASAPCFGGGEQYLLDIADGLRKKGHTVTIAVNRTLAAEFLQRGVDVDELRLGPKLSRRNALQIFWFPVWFLYITAWLLHRSLRQRVDVVHCQYKKEQVLVSLAARLLRLRLIWTEHGPLPGFVARQPWLVAAYRKLAALPEQIIAVSAATRQDLIAHGIDGTRVTVIYNGVAMNPLGQERRAPIPARLLSIGRLIPGKGHSLLIRSMPSVLAEVPQASLVIAGDGPLAGSLATLVDELGLGHAVKLLGHVERDMVRREIEMSSVIVMPSVPQIGGEGLPYAIVEAMERGRPVVATRTGGIPELVEDGRTGLLVDNCTPDGLAAAILSLLKDPERRETFSGNARSAAEHRFSFTAMIDSTEQALAPAAG